VTNGSDWLSEIRKRLFVRLTLGYLAGAWIILQAAEVLGEVVGISHGILKTLFLLVVLGLPAVAAIGWMYDWRRLHGKSSLSRTALGVLTVLVGLIFLLYLWPDEDLDPQVRRWLNSADGNIDYPDNMTYRIWGAFAAVGDHPYALGRHLTDVYGATDTLNRSDEVCFDGTDLCVKGLGMPPEAESVDFTFDLQDLCSFAADQDCLSRILADIAGLPTLIKANRVPLDRYLSLHNAPTSTTVIRSSVDAPIPPFVTLVQGQRLTVRQAIMALAEGDFDQTRRIQIEELAFHRAVLAQSDSIIAKMISVRLIEWDILARIAIRSNFSGIDLGPSVQRLSEAERSMIRSIRLDSLAIREFLYQQAGDAGLIDLIIDDKFYRLLFEMLPLKLNATANLVMRPYIETAKASLLEPHQFLQWSQQYAPPPVNTVEWIYNGAGAALVSVGLPDYRDYIARVHDLDVLIALSQVADLLIDEGVTRETIAGRLLSLPDAYRNPLTGRRPFWKDGVLAYDYEPQPWRRTIPELRLPLSGKVRAPNN
jgi:hypothetical protein